MITPYLHPIIPKEVEDQIYLFSDEEFLNGFVDSSCAFGMLNDANRQKLSECIFSLFPEYTSEERNLLLQHIDREVQLLALNNSSILFSYRDNCNIPEEVLRSIVLMSIKNMVLSYIGNPLAKKYMKQKMGKDLGRRYFELTYDFPDFLRKCRIYEDLYRKSGKLDYIPLCNITVTPMILIHSLRPEFWNLICFCLQESIAMHIRRYLDPDDTVSFRKIFKMHWGSNENHKNPIKLKYRQLCGYREDDQNCKSDKEWEAPEGSLVDRVKTWIDGRIAHTDLKHIDVNPKVIEDVRALAIGFSDILNDISDLHDLQVEYHMPDKYSDTKELLAGLTYLFIEKYSLDGITIGKEER